MSLVVEVRAGEVERSQWLGWVVLSRKVMVKYADGREEVRASEVQMSPELAALPGEMDRQIARLTALPLPALG